uniref:Endonuclease domain-containing 1 protein n=1 Tax=Dicentrarchus labrax TaxID=13489 RepID=A0A8P4KFP1_DICLA
MEEATLLILDPGSRSSGSSSAPSGSHTIIPAAVSMARALRTLSTTLHRSELGLSLRPHDFLHFGQLDNSSALASQHWMMHTWQKWCPHSRITGSRNSSKHTGQLAFSRASSEMKHLHIPMDQNVIESQAVLQDYKNSNYTKGHLNPSMHQKTKEDREATFTLTNIVPQRAGSNSGPWNGLENEVLKKYKAFCNGLMYVITGAIPYESEPRWINNRVSVPEYMWSAYCCPSYNTSLPKYAKPFFPTYAAVGRNDRNSGEEIVPVNVKARASVRGYDVRRMSLETLEDILAQRLAMPISLFHGQCQ